MIRALFVSGALTLAATAASAHDRLCNGRPVPPNIKMSCCGRADVHMLLPDEYRQNGDGSWSVQFDDDSTHAHYAFHLPDSRAQPSDDTCAWIFFTPTVTDETGLPRVWCFTVPMPS